MIKSAVKNYFQQFKYVFSGMGVIYLALLISIFSFFRGAANILAGAVDTSFAELGVYLGEQLSGITFSALFENNFIANFVNGILAIFNENGEFVIAKLTILLTAIVSFLLLALKLASYLMRRLIRKELSDSETKRGLLVMVFRYITTLLSAVVVAVLSYYWIYSAVFLLIAFCIIKAFEQLFTTWYIYCRKSIKLKDMYRFKYVLHILFANFASLALNLVVIALLAVIVNLFFALLLAIPLVVYSFTVIDFTTVDYFNKQKRKAEQGTKKNSEPTKIEVPQANEPTTTEPMTIELPTTKTELVPEKPAPIKTEITETEPTKTELVPTAIVPTQAATKKSEPTKTITETGQTVLLKKISDKKQEKALPKKKTVKPEAVKKKAEHIALSKTMPDDSALSALDKTPTTPKKKAVTKKSFAENDMQQRKK